MEIVLVAITLVSLLVALTMSVAAWRLSRAERTRQAARIAALSAAAVEPEPVARPEVHAAPVVEPPAEPIAVGEVRQSPPWQTARVSTFAVPPRASVEPQVRAAASPTGARTPAPDLLMRPAGGEDAAATATSLGDGFLATGTTASGTPRQRTLAVAAIFLFAIVLGGGYWTIYGARSTGSSVSAAAVDRTPLELISLRHERRGSRLAVTGLIRNPVAGPAVKKLTAVVFLFDSQGAFITSAKTDVDFLELAPGDESPFVIALDAPANVARYRVSFRNEAGVVPHVDRRGQAPIAVSEVK